METGGRRRLVRSACFLALALAAAAVTNGIAGAQVSPGGSCGAGGGTICRETRTCLSMIVVKTCETSTDYYTANES